MSQRFLPDRSQPVHVPLEYHLPIVASSDPAAGAQNLSDDGSQFEVQLDTPIVIPKEAKNCVIRVLQAQVWWTIPNIVTGVNDQFRCTYDDGILEVTQQVTIPQGLYDLDALNQAIDVQLQAVGFPEGLFTLIADNATQKVIIQANDPYATTGLRIDFTISNSIREILGFDSQLLPAGGNTTQQEQFIGDNTANFNTVNSLLIHSDLTSRGILVNNTYNQSIVQVVPDVEVGSLITFRPFQPLRIPCPDLQGATRNSLRFWLTSEVNERVDTAGEYWNVNLEISYYV